MYLSKIKLVNFVGIYIGQKCETIEIDMDNQYPLTLIRSPNGKGKSVLISALSSPFAYDGGIDNRSNTNIIRTGYLGEKEMTYVDGNDVYYIHHYYKPNQHGSHSVKSYICKNGVEMNPNGNVSSFEQIINSVFGINDKDLMLLRLGTNSTSFTSLSSMDRKKYLSRIIGDIDIYMQMFTMIQYDIRVNRTMISNYSDEMAKLKIDSIEETSKRNEKRRKRSEQLLMDIGRLDAEKKIIINNDTDIDELISEKVSIEKKMTFASTIDDSIKKVDVSTLRERRKKVDTDKNATQIRINELKSTIDSNNRSIEFAKIDLQNTMIDDTLSDKIASLQKEIDTLEAQYKKFKPKMSSKEYSNIYQHINTIITLMTVIIGYENTIVDMMLKIYSDQTDIDQWVDKSLSTIVDPNSKLSMCQHMKRLIGDGYCIPDCSDVNCVYRKIGEMINTNENDDEMTVDFIQSVRKSLATFNRMIQVQSQVIPYLPKQLQDIISQDNLKQLTREGKLFSMELFDNYKLMLYGYESYQQKLEQMRSYREQESSKQRLIIMKGEAEKRINTLSESNRTLTTKLSSAISDMDKISKQLEELDVQIGKKLEYDAVKDMLTSYSKRLIEIDKTIDETNQNRSKLSIIREKMDMYNNELSELQQMISETDTAISLYQKYESEIDRLNKLIVEQNKILRNVSVKERGIPILYMKTFFDKIRIKCNEILDITYDGNLKIGEFDPSSPVFDIPYIKNGTKIKDVKFASQGEQPVINIAISFAMSSLIANKKYNILCCDELDSTLDHYKKIKYPEMLNNHIATMGIDQCFVISHSDVFDTIPTNVIDMSDSPEKIHGSNMYEIKRS